MELLIVRHAIAFDRDGSRWPVDRERPLTREGIRRARCAAAGLARLAPRPTRVLTSPLVRARATAAILTQYARWPEASPCPLLEPGAAPAELLELLARSGQRSMAVVGHEPDLGSLLSACLPGKAAGNAFSFRKMGAAQVSFRGRPRPGAGTLRWLVTPRLLRTLAPE